MDKIQIKFILAVFFQQPAFGLKYLVSDYKLSIVFFIHLTI